MTPLKITVFKTLRMAAQFSISLVVISGSHALYLIFVITLCYYIDDLLSVNNDNFGNSISEIYPSKLELKDTTLCSTEVCYLDTKIAFMETAAHLFTSACMTKEKTSTSGLFISPSWTATSLPLRRMCLRISISEIC